MDETELTLTQAAEYLKSNGGVVVTKSGLRAAIKTERLKAQLVDKTPSPYYVVSKADLKAWAVDENYHKRGNPHTKKASTP